MPLAIGTGVTALNTSFYAGMCFLKSENQEDYEWLIATYKELYKELDIPLPGVWLSDDEANIPKAINKEISPTAIHLLCVWHIEKNVVDNLRKHFGPIEEWDRFYKGPHTIRLPNGDEEDRLTSDWYKLLYAITKDEFNLQWQHMQDKYDFLIVDYLSEYIVPKKKKWSRIWTDKYLHFNNHASSRGEEAHAVLKATLKSSTGDLRDVAKKAANVCDRQRTKYVKALDEAKQRLDRSLRKAVFQDLFAYITPFALRTILPQYQKVMDAQKNNRGLPTCKGHLRATMGLPCAHEIERIINDTDGNDRVKLASIHPHWHFQKPPRHYVEPTMDFQDVDDVLEDAPEPVRNPLLNIIDPAVVKSKGRPKGTLNRRQKAFENSTRRQSSSFEHALTKAKAKTTTTTIDLTSSQIQVPATQSATQPPTQRKRKATSKGDREGVRGGAAIDRQTSAKAPRRRRPTKADLEAENKQLKEALKASTAASTSIIATTFEGVISRPSKDVVDVGSEDDDADLPEL